MGHPAKGDGPGESGASPFKFLSCFARARLSILASLARCQQRPRQSSRGRRVRVREKGCRGHHPSTSRQAICNAPSARARLAFRLVARPLVCALVSCTFTSDRSYHVSVLVVLGLQTSIQVPGVAEGRVAPAAFLLPLPLRLSLWVQLGRTVREPWRTLRGDSRCFSSNPWTLEHGRDCAL